MYNTPEITNRMTSDFFTVKQRFTAQLSNTSIIRLFIEMTHEINRIRALIAPLHFTKEKILDHLQ